MRKDPNLRRFDSILITRSGQETPVVTSILPAMEHDAVIGGMTGVHQFTRIGRMAMVGGMSRITQDVPPFMLVEGNPATAHGINSVKMQRSNMPAETQSALKKAFRFLYRDGLSTRQAVDRIRAELPAIPEVQHLLAFIDASERGILK